MEQNINIITNGKKSKNKFKLLFFISLATIIVMLLGYIWMFIGPFTLNSNYLVTILNSTQEVTSNFVVGENYQFKFESKQKSITYVDKAVEYKITIKNSNVIKEMDGFLGVTFEDFAYNTKTGLVECNQTTFVKAFGEQSDTIAFNICPTTIGVVEINVFANGTKIITYSNNAQLP